MPIAVLCALGAVLGWVICGARVLEGFENRRRVLRSILVYWISGAAYSMGNYAKLKDKFKGEKFRWPSPRCSKGIGCVECHFGLNGHYPWCSEVTR